MNDDQIHEKIQQADPEKKDLVLFQYLSALEKHLQQCPVQDLNQKSVIETVLKYITAATPKLSAPIWHLMARILDCIYIRGDTRSLFDTIQSLQAVLNLKKVEQVQTRIAAIHIIGSLEYSHGNKVVSLLAESITSTQKYYKNAKETELSLKMESLSTLVRIVRGAGKGVSEQSIKELLKTAKAGLLDKVQMVRASSIEV